MVSASRPEGIVSDVPESRTERYVFWARVIHWLMAAGFVFMWVCGFAMTKVVEEDSGIEELLFGLHISVGVTLLFLLIVRIVIRVVNRPPALPDGMSGLEKKASHLGHLALYLLPAAAIMIGWVETDLGGHGVAWFGIPMPKIFPTMEEWSGIKLEDTLSELHALGAYLMLAIAIGHVAAVAKHRWIDGHDVLYRMTFRR